MKCLRFLCTMVVLLATITVMANEQDYMTYHSCNFDAELPGDYTMYDVDAQTLHYTMVQAGLKQGVAWNRRKEIGTQNYYIASACRYKEEEGVELKASDKWLVTPAIWVRGKEAKLSWQGMSVTNRLEVGAGYEILVSTTGNTPADFTSAAIYTVAEESLDEWTQHTVNLDEYQNQHIYIAFHNNSAQGEILAIDNVDVTGHRGVCDFVVTTPTHLFGSNSLYVTASITSYSDEPINDIRVSYTYNDMPITQEYIDINLSKYETFDVTFERPIEVANGDTVSYSVGAIVSGLEQDEIVCSTVAFMFEPERRVVIEEGTGMWCTYCPKGIVAMDILHEKYPDSFIGIAIHYDDPMALDEYFGALGLVGLPSGWINRKYLSDNPMVLVENNGVSEYVVDQGGFETYFVEELNIVVPTNVDITSVAYKDNQVTVNTTVRSAIDLDNLQYQLAFVVIEENVWQVGYYQKNGFAGKDALINGWENRPSTVTSDFAFSHVARAIYDDYQGVVGSVPEQLLAGEEYETSYTFDLPSTILNYDNVYIVAMLIDLTDGSIVNADQSESITAIDATKVVAEPYCVLSGNCIDVILPSATPATLSLYNTVGSLVAMHTTAGYNMSIPAPASGIYVVSIVQDGVTTNHKIVVP